MRLALVNVAVRLLSQTFLGPFLRRPLDRILAGFYFLHIDGDLPTKDDTELRSSPRRVSHFGTGDQGLRRNTAGVDAGAAELPAFDDCHLPAGFCHSNS